MSNHSNTLPDVKNAFWSMAKLILKDIITDNPDKWIRKMYPKGGAPDFTISDNVVFLNATPRDDDYSKQRDSVYKTEQGTVMRNSMRTRVWDIKAQAYGPRAYDVVTAMKDGVFLPEVQMLLAKKGFYLVPNMPVPIQANEIFAGQWWERWDITLTFNEEYLSKQDVGAIEHVYIRAEALR